LRAFRFATLTQKLHSVYVNLVKNYLS